MVGGIKMLPDRVAALIVRNKRLLLITGYDEKFYWTPGGKIEGKESHETCLKRELYSELNIKVTSFKHYLTVMLPNQIKGRMQKNHYYLVQYNGKIKPKQEITKTIWYSKQNFLDKDISVSEGFVNKVIPKLIEYNYL